jgi:hypothetical protein
MGSTFNPDGARRREVEPSTNVPVGTLVLAVLGLGYPAFDVVGTRR